MDSIKLLTVLVVATFIVSIASFFGVLSLAGSMIPTPVTGNVAKDVEVKAAEPKPTQPEVTRASVTADDDPSKGPADAKVTIIEFSDFQCPFCARVQPTLKQIADTYGDQVRIVFRDFPLSFHNDAQKAAEAAECADDQGIFWEYHDLLFANQGSLGVLSLKQYATNLGMDTVTFDSCLDSGKYAQEVKDDLADGSRAGVRGTPAFFINGIPLSGARPFADFKQIIDSELAS